MLLGPALIDGDCIVHALWIVHCTMYTLYMTDGYRASHAAEAW